MRLHKDRALFLELIEATSEKYQLQEEFVEKDYFASLLLKNIVELEPETIFKGGTSLSKCFRLINRFSEDIDINYKLNEKVTQGERKLLNKSIKQAILNSGLSLTNKDSIQSNRMYNEYAVRYPMLTQPTGALRNELLVENYLFLKSFPFEKKIVNDYISDLLVLENEISIIHEFELGGFESYVQKVTRTFMDKLFAICDYYETGKTKRLSRHLYDLHMIWINTKFNNTEFKSLLNLVSEERSHRRVNVSAKDGFPFKATLEKISDSNYFKNDYNLNTKLLLFKSVDYESTIKSLREISSSGLVPEFVKGRVNI